MSKVDDALFGTGLLDEALATKRTGNLSERFQVPPFTVLSARDGWWLERKRAWLALGIQSELGRGDDGSGADIATVDVGDQLGAITSAGRAVPEGYSKKVDTPTVKRRKAPAEAKGPIVIRPAQLPPSDWTAPIELPSLEGVRQLAFDTETRDDRLRELGPGFRRGAYMVGMSLGTDDGRRFYLPTRHEAGGNLDPEMVYRWARSELGKFDGELIGARLLYDLDACATEGIFFKNAKAFHDVQVAEPLLDEWRYEYSLDVLSKDYLGEGKDEGLLRQSAAACGWTTDDDVKANLWRLPASHVGPYAIGDVDRPLRIWPKQLARLEDENLMPIYGIERKLIPLLLRMRLRGVPVNMNRAPEITKGLREERDALLAKLKSLAGRDAEFMAPASFADALSDRGLKFPLTAKTKQPSITKGWLERNSGDELCATVMEGRSVNTVVNTFLDGHIHNHVINGRIHGEFNQLKGDDGGTIARFSASNPNLQNLPARDGRLGPLVRSLFIPEDGEDWQRDDYSQIEYRLLAHYAVGDGADACRLAYNTDPETDYHKLCAKFCGIDPEDSIKRKRVKNINFAKGYGAGGEKLASLLGCSLPEALDFINLYETSLPFTVKTYDKAMQWANKQGFISTIGGRKQRFLLWEPSNNWGTNKKPPMRREEALKAYGPAISRYMTYAALNRKLQASAADMMKKGMVDADEAGVFDVIGAPLVTVHDELGTSIPRTKEGDEAGRELTHIMEQVYTLKVPVTVESQRGAHWGDCK